MPTRTMVEPGTGRHPEYDVFQSACPARELHDRISDKWVSLIMNALADGERRYSALARTVVGVSQKMLTQTLRNLERDGLVSRTVIPQRPVRVSYALTPLGNSLLPVMRAIKDWAEHHIDDVHSARATFDARDPDDHSDEVPRKTPSRR